MRRTALAWLALLSTLTACDDTGVAVDTADLEVESSYLSRSASNEAIPRVIVHPAPTSTGPASAPARGDPLVNGSFESGFAGWTTITTGAPFLPWRVSGAGVGSGFGMAPTAPQDGDSVAWNGFDGGGPMTFVIHQDVTVDMGRPFALLTWSDRIQWDYTLGTIATVPRRYSVQVRDPTSGEVLDTIHKFSTGAPSSNLLGDTGWQQHVADLSAYRGQTIRIAFEESIPQSFTGPGQFELDAISLGPTTGHARVERAQVLNNGESKPGGSCHFSGRFASRVTVVRTPRGGGTLSCHWDDYPFFGEVKRALVLDGFWCYLNFGGWTTTTTRSRFVLAPSQRASMVCQFENVS